jgi:hypothetical protein
MLPSPGTDFDFWSNLLIGTTEPNGEYREMLSDVESLLAEIARDGQLSAPITDQTDSFIKTVFPTFITALLNLGRLTDPEIEAIHHFLTRIIFPVTVATLKGLLPSDAVLLKLLSRQETLYAKNIQPFRLCHGVAVEFLQGESLRKFTETLLAEPTVDLFVTFARIVAKFTVDTQTVHIIGLSNLAKPLSHVLSQFDASNVRQFDNDKLSAIVKMITSTAFGTLDGDFVRVLLQFADLCLRSEILRKQIIGAKLVSMLSQFYRETFQAWAKDVHFVDFLIASDAHMTVMQTLSTSVTQALAADPLPLDALAGLYSRCQHAHTSERQHLNAFLAQALRSADEATLSAFLSSILKEESVNPDFIAFLQTLLMHLAVNAAAVVKIAQFILGLFDSDLPDEVVFGSISKMRQRLFARDLIPVVGAFVTARIGTRYATLKKLVTVTTLCGEKVRAGLIQRLLDQAPAATERAPSLVESCWPARIRYCRRTGSRCSRARRTDGWRSRN